MKIGDAQKGVKRRYVIGVFTMIISALFILCSIMKTTYLGIHGDRSAFATLTARLEDFINFVYQNTQFISLIWDWAPVYKPKELNDSGNLEFAICAWCYLTGQLIFSSGSTLSARIKKTKDRVEELLWEQSLLRDEGVTTGAKPDILQVTVELGDKDQWYKRPLGLLVIGIAVAVIAQWANLKFGFAKL